MRFAVFALATLPDTASTRRLLGLDDLDDVAVTKVLAHRRRQETGASEALRWDQRAIGAVTLLQHSVDGVQMQTLGVGSHDEAGMLRAYYGAALRNGRMLSWDRQRQHEALIRFRTLLNGVSYPAYWQAKREGADPYFDMCGWLSPGIDDRPGLDETARRLGYPGLLQRDEEDLTDAWLQGRPAELTAFSELAALNSYLIALRMFVTTGEMTPHDSARVTTTLRDELRRRQGEHLAGFLAAWERP